MFAAVITVKGGPDCSEHVAYRLSRRRQRAIQEGLREMPHGALPATGRRSAAGMEAARSFTRAALIGRGSRKVRHVGDRAPWILRTPRSRRALTRRPWHNVTRDPGGCAGGIAAWAMSSSRASRSVALSERGNFPRSHSCPETHPGRSGRPPARALLPHDLTQPLAAIPVSAIPGTNETVSVALKEPRQISIEALTGAQTPQSRLRHPLQRRGEFRSCRAPVNKGFVVVLIWLDPARHAHIDNDRARALPAT